MQPMSPHQMLSGQMDAPMGPTQPKTTAADVMAECQAAVDLAMSDPEDTNVINVPKITGPGAPTA